MAVQHDHGKKGEDLAVQLLEKKDHVILERNWRFGREEIDIITQTPEFICFVEVKARKSRDFGSPESFVSPQKQKRIIRTAAAYLEQSDVDLEARFDIVSVLLLGEKAKVEHLEDAFMPHW